MLNFKENKKVFWVLLVFVQVFLAFPVFAQFSDATPVTLENILDVIETIAQFMLFAGAFIAVIFIVYGGIKWMSAKGDTTKVADARKTIINGLIGAMIVLGIGTIFSTAEHIVGALSGGFGL